MIGIGLFTTAQNGMEAAPVVLTGVRMVSHVGPEGQRTVVEQVFVNKERQAIEAVYTFPLPEGAAVCGFEAITGDRVLTGEIEELAKGMEKYDEAVKGGYGAFMAELWRPDVFSTRIGNIKPGQAVLIRLTYVAAVEIADRRMRLSFPTTIAPRYGTATGMDPVDAAIESDALNPPHVLAVGYGLELAVTLDLGLKLKSVASPTHGVRVEHEEAGTQWKVTLAAVRTEMNRDVVLEAELARDVGATAWVEEGVEPEEHFVAVSFLPEFTESELGGVAAREVVFVLDCSGSMQGPSIEQARQALALCLKCLSEGDRFNVCRFSSRFELMRPESVPYTQATLDASLAWLAGVQADLGGTELHAPLEAVLKGVRGQQMREIMVLTDGQVTNEPALIRLAGAYRGKARIFSFGIGPASSEFLVKGMARATGGASDFVAQQERIEEKVLRMFGRMASSRMENVEVVWNCEADMEPRVASLFDGEPLRVSARVRGRVPEAVTLRAQWEGKQKQWTVPVVRAAARREGRVGTTGACWARARLAQLELTGQETGLKDMQLREMVVGLSKRYGVLSKETTFIAVEHRSLEERTRGEPAMRRVPVMLAKGWGGTDSDDWSMGCLMDRAMAAPAALAAPAAAARPGGLMRKLFRHRVGAQGEISEAVRTKAPADPLQSLLMRQSAEGSFAWDVSLNDPTFNGRKWNGSAHQNAIKALITTRDSALAEKILGTALALRVLEECFAEQADLWILAAKKARRWLAAMEPAVAKWCEAKP